MWPRAGAERTGPGMQAVFSCGPGAESADRQPTFLRIGTKKRRVTQSVSVQTLPNCPRERRREPRRPKQGWTRLMSTSPWFALAASLRTAGRKKPRQRREHAVPAASAPNHQMESPDFFDISSQRNYLQSSERGSRTDFPCERECMRAGWANAALVRPWPIQQVHSGGPGARARL